MKFSSILLATIIAQASAFSSPRVAVSSTSRYAATLEAEAIEEKAVSDAPVLDKEPVTTSMDVEKDWPVEDFVKDSERVLP
jgi:hypothetical protein